MRFSAAPRPGNESAFRRSNHQPAGLNQKLLRRSLLQFSPQLVSALHQWDIKWMLKVGFADDARLSVRGAQRMRRVEPIESEHLAVASGQMKSRRASHPAQAGYDDVESFSHR